MLFNIHMNDIIKNIFICEETFMVTALLVIIFIAYIGLGIPDSILGAAWPAIYEDLGLPISNVSYITSAIYIGTIISSFMSGRIIKWLGTAKVAFFSTIITAFALLGFAYSKNIVCFCLLALPLGLGAGSIDTALNNYVALHYKVTHMNFLHCFYGIGVTLSPFLMSMALSQSNSWRNGYKIMFAIQFSIAVMLLAAMPLWKKVNADKIEVETTGQPLSILQAVKMKKAKSAIGVFMTSCAVETACLVWANTYLVEAKGVTADKAAGVVTVYFIGLTLGRFLSGLVSSKVTSDKIVMFGQGVVLTAVIIMLLHLPVTASYIGLFLVGFGIGPVFPNMTHLTPKFFGEEVSQSMIGIQMGFAYISIMVSPIIFSVIANCIGVSVFPYYLLILFAFMFISTIFLFKKR